MRTVVTLATRYLVARSRQSLLTIAGIVVGVVALTLNQSLMGGLRGRFIANTLGASPHVRVTRQPVEPFDPASPTRRALQHVHDPLLVQVQRPPIPEEQERILNPDALGERIRAVPGVAATAPLVTGPLILGYAGFWEPVVVNGIVPPDEARVVDFASKLVQGSAAELERDLNAVILGYYLADRLRVRVGDRVSALAEDGSVTGLRVVALYRSNIYDIDNGTIWVNLRRAQALLGMVGAVNQIQVRARDLTRADEVARRVEYAVGMDAESWQEANRNILGLLNMIVTIQSLVAVFTMSVAGFGIAGNLIMTVSEKTFDIGVLKAMGMRSRDVRLIFLLLAVWLMAVGLVIGLGLSFVLIEIVSRIPTPARPQPGAIIASETFPMLKSWTIYCVSAVFALVVSVAAGYSPASRAARLEPLGIIRNAG